MRKIQRGEIIVRNRQRTQMDAKKRLELRDSILSKGLMHPPVVRANADGTGYILVAGGRRLTCIDDIQSTNGTFACDGDVIFPGEVPVIWLTDLTDVGYREAELEENIIREDLPWQDRVRALDEIHKSRTEADPATTVTATSAALAEKGGVISINEGAPPVTSERRIRKQIVEAKVIAENMHLPAVRNARNANEAFAIAVSTLEKQHMAELVKRRLVVRPEDSCSVINGDLHVEMPKLSSDTFDLILADPPYGVNAGSSGFRARTVHHHEYADDPETARAICKTILMEGFRICKPRANILLFVSIDLWFWCREFSRQCGWEPFNTPVIWQKSESEGLAPWGQQGFRRTYDPIFFATKGTRGLIHSPTDILNFKRVSRSEREYAAEKPVPLLRALIEAATLPGDRVLDPCCGSGSALEAARILPARKATGIELDKSAFDLAVVRAHKEDHEPTVSESETQTPNLDTL